MPCVCLSLSWIVHLLCVVGGSLWVVGVVVSMGSNLCIVVDLIGWIFLFACESRLVDAFCVVAYVAWWMVYGWFWWGLEEGCVCL